MRELAVDGHPDCELSNEDRREIDDEVREVLGAGGGRLTLRMLVGRISGTSEPEVMPPEYLQLSLSNYQP